jgi:2-C-methyl-D-erythritol 2,4-cyclodiphosphate synthase
MQYKIGIGYDIHRLAGGRKLFLGGIRIPYPQGLLGHSDADALLHAICDALLGALSAGDIGDRFPDTDPRYRNIAGTKLLEDVAGLARKKKFSIANIDSVIIAQAPRLGPFKEKMRNKISRTLKIKNDCVSVKAKTAEGLGEIGHKKAVACYAVVLLAKEGKK